MKNLKGLGVALVTPFNANKEIDYVGLEKLIKHQIKGGTDYLVVQGTTGESATLSKKEKQEVLDFVIKVNDGKLPVVLGIGGNNTKAIIEDYKSFNLKGVSAILSASPYYNKPSQEGIYQHYKKLTENFELPIILYNVPGRTASNMSPETVLRLANDFPVKICGIKEASGSIEQVMKIVQGKPEEFLVISGDDPLTLPMMVVGVVGAISVVANAYPKITSDIISNAFTKDFDKAKKAHYTLLTLIDYLFADGNPGGIKETLKHLGVCDHFVRLPLVPVSKNVSDLIKKEVKKIG